MKIKMNIKNIVIMATVGIISLFFINMSLAANTAKVAVETANLRETADENGKILELLSMDKEVEIIEKTGDWYQIKVDGMTGYVRQDLLTVDEEVAKEETPQKENQEEKVEKPKTQENATNLELGKYQIIENTKLKIVPVINATDIIEVKKEEQVEVTEIVNGWACVETQTTKGWIRKEKLQKPEEKVETNKEEEKPAEKTVIKTLFVNTTTVNIRKEANTSAEIVTTLPINTAVDVVAEENGWSEVKVSGKEGYISSSLLSETKQQTSRKAEAPRKATKAVEKEKKAETPAPAPSGKGNTVLETAQKYLGCKYVYGGSSPSGFDCSGFTSYVFRLHGVSLSRTAAGQYQNGSAVSRNNLQPGDLVMFGKSGINHVGIYMGSGKMIHAENKNTGVTISTITSGYYNNNYVGARRVI